MLHAWPVDHSHHLSPSAELRHIGMVPALHVGPGLPSEHHSTHLVRDEREALRDSEDVGRQEESWDKIDKDVGV